MSLKEDSENVQPGERTRLCNRTGQDRNNKKDPVGFGRVFFILSFAVEFNQLSPHIPRQDLQLMSGRPPQLQEPPLPSSVLQ